MSINIHDLSLEEFRALPLVVEGESKEIRAAGYDRDRNVELCVIRYKPTIYSFTSNRTAVVDGSDKLRLQATKVFVDVLRGAGIDHAYLDVGENFVLSERIIDPPNVETIVKRYHSGTSKHRYYGMAGTPVRRGSMLGGLRFLDEDAYPHAIVRFDWRNPFWHPDKVARLRAEMPALPERVVDWPEELRQSVKIADEAMPEDIADWFIDTKQAKRTALKAFNVLTRFLGDRSIVLYDVCFFIDATGNRLFGEISQDCGRFRHFDLGSLDKDVWRAGGSAEQVLAKWQTLLELIRAPR